MIPIEADLHTHTNCSDGMLTPAELVQKAHQLGLKALAITDHDTILGVPPGIEAARAYAIQIISGVELSVQFHRRELHLLGYGMDIESDALTDYLDYFVEKRKERAKRIVEQLDKLGLRLDFEALSATHTNVAIGRPHIARALVEAGYVKNTGRAFARYLADGRPADVPKELPYAKTAIDVIHAAGGVTALAHPGHWVSDREIYALRDLGMDGIEIIHPTHDDMLTSFYTGVANKLGMIKSGGSDYHGQRSDDESNFGKTGLTHEQFERFRLGIAS